MPTDDCFKDIGELFGRMAAHERREEEIEKVIFRRLDEINEKLDALRSGRDQATGAVWALSRIGAGVVAAFGLIGWIAVHGVPEWVKSALK